MSQSREELVKELKETMTFPLYDAGMIADFILDDRKRVVEPLVKSLKDILDKHHSKEFVVGKDCYMHVNFQSIANAYEALRNAGVL